MAFSLPRLLQAVAIVTKEGWPTGNFHLWWQSVVEKIEAQEATQDTLISDLETAVADIIAAQAAADAAALDAAAAQAAADAAAADAAAVAGDLAGYVPRNNTPAWTSPTGTLARTTFAAYAGQTVSNPPTQAEVQAIDDHLVILSRRLAALITDLKVDVLT